MCLLKKHNWLSHRLCFTSASSRWILWIDRVGQRPRFLFKGQNCSELRTGQSHLTALNAKKGILLRGTGNITPKLLLLPWAQPSNRNREQNVRISSPKSLRPQCCASGCKWCQYFWGAAKHFKKTGFQTPSQLNPFQLYGKQTFSP